MFNIVCIVVVIVVLLFITIFNPIKKDTIELFNEDTTINTTPTAAPTYTLTDRNSVINQINSMHDDIINTITTGGTYEYVEDITAIPFYEQLVLYASPFSEKTNYDSEQRVYIPEMSKWNNFITPNQEFMIINNSTVASLSSNIKYPNGISLNNVQLLGINADILNKVDFSITAFTAIIAIKVIEDFNFNGVNEIELFSISLETPNYIRLTLEPDLSDNRNVLLYSHVGDASSTTTKSGGSLPKTDFNNEVVISAVYTKTGDKSIRRIFLNNVAVHESEEYVLNYNLILGNSRISINKHRNLNATMYAFMYYNRALSLDDHILVYEYFRRQASMLPMIMALVEKLSKQQIDFMKNILKENSNIESELQSKLDQCNARKSCKTSDEPPPKSEFKYKIHHDGSVNVSDADIQSCPLLRVKRRVKDTSQQPDNADIPNIVVPSSLNTSSSSMPSITVPSSFNTSSLNTPSITIPSSLNTSSLNTPSITIPSSLNTSPLNTPSITVPSSLNTSPLGTVSFNAPSPNVQSYNSPFNITLP